MKKLTIALIAIVSALIMGFAMAGCSSDVKGNTYVFNSVSVTYGPSVNDSDKLSEADLNEIRAQYEGVEISFENDGTYKVSGDVSEVSYYVQDGDTVYIYRTKEQADAGDSSKAIGQMKVDGKKISVSMSEGDSTLTIIYEKK